MVDRTRPRAAIHRQHVPWRTYDAIVRKTCLHVDAWLFQAPDDQLYLYVLVQAGGVQHLSAATYRCEPGALVPVENMPALEREGVQRHVDSPWSRRNAPWLAALHWSHIVPLVRQPAEAFKGHRSIVLHCVYTDPKLNDPCEGLENLYAVTGRASRDAAQRTTPERQPATRAASPWDAKERSVLRTLDKLLK